MSAHKCEVYVWTVDSYRSYPCNKNAAHEHGGHWFCKTHHPPTVKAKSDVRMAKWQAELDAKNVVKKSESAAKAEQKRRAECYPDLLSALEYALEFLQDWEDVSGAPYARKARAAIAKATGVQP